MTNSTLTNSEFDPYYDRYIKKLSPHTELLAGFKAGLISTINFFQSIPSSKHSYAYGKGKWTIKEVLQHLIDTERIFIHRCFRIARRDSTPIPEFNQEIYNRPSGANKKEMENLILEYKSGRNNSITLLNSLSDDDLKFIGVANHNAMSARAAAFTVIGHELWHIEIIKERYL